MIDEHLRVLVVCTANQCRSPLGAAILARALADRGAAVSVSSAGTRAIDARATHGTLLAAHRHGLELSNHRSVALDPTQVNDADLILVMERRHVQEVALVDPGAFARTFTLKELVRRGSAAGPRAVDESVATWLARAGAGRTARDVLGRSTDDDVADPTVDPLTDHDALAAELCDLVDALVALAWP